MLRDMLVRYFLILGGHIFILAAAVNPHEGVDADGGGVLSIVAKMSEPGSRK